MARVSLGPAFQLSPKPSGNPGLHSHASSLPWAPVSSYVRSMAQGVSGLKLGSFLDFHQTDHFPRASVGVAEFPDDFRGQTREVHIGTTQLSSFSKVLCLSHLCWLLATALAPLCVFRLPLSLISPFTSLLPVQEQSQ